MLQDDSGVFCLTVQPTTDAMGVIGREALFLSLPLPLPDRDTHTHAHATAQADGLFMQKTG